ncbi:glycosyltransferase family 4 protein [Microscilla marina]|uniref:Glycosyltransferase, putative n=1 Tax=Microscilla marina ATCC 23134 TaxID=313606 RepID=A1ZI86_MICM2|nr:glycosyltransferase family 4 protein [Microscilla marina]EAY29754.1 glycosyltransferase, putative [Microscilla marina ATCC 23134]
MKVLHITNAYPTDDHPGFGIFIKEQIHSLDKKLSKNDVVVIDARNKGKTAYFKAFLKLRKLVKDYDILHCHHAFVAFVILMIKPQQKIVVSFLSNGTPDSLNLPKKISARLTKYITSKSDAIIFKCDIPPQYQHHPSVHYLPNGVNTVFFTPIDKNIAKEKLGLNKNKTYILFVSAGNLHRVEKRYDIYKQVIALLKSKYHLTDIEELHLVNSSRSLVPHYYGASSAHILTSDFEGSPNSVKESISCNIPIVSTDVGNVASMLKNVSNCYVSNNSTPEELAYLVHKCLEKQATNDFDLRQVLFEQKLDMESTAQKLFNIYNNLLS